VGAGGDHAISKGKLREPRKAKGMKILLVLALAVVLAPPARAEATPPTNDDFDAAGVVSNLPFVESVDASGATVAPDDPGDCSPGPSVWYRFTPANDFSVQVETYGSDYDTVLAAYTGTRGNLTIVDPIVACNDDAMGSRLLLDLTAGTTYYFAVYAFPGSPPGPLSFGMWDLGRAAANDDFDDAIPITTLPFKDSADNTAATSAEDDPACDELTGATVWYSFSPDRDIRVYATSQAFVTSETYVALYTGARGSLTQLACATFPPQFQWDAKAGETYYIQVGTYGALGVFNLLVQPAFRITAFAVNRTARLNHRTVTVSGVISCNYRTGFVVVSGTVTQKSSSGEFTTDTIPCPPSGSAAWTASTTSGTKRPFEHGPGIVSATASGQFGGGTYVSQDELPITQSVVIKPGG
jgi:hypothetical protein